MKKINMIIAYENGQLSDKKILQLFSQLIKSGQIWSLQGWYSTTASALIQSGLISKTGQITEKGKLY